MPASIGVNLRVTGHCSQGGRKYMEDLFSVAYQQTEDERDLEYAFFGIYDGHGGSEAAAFAKEHLMDSIVKQRHFWSDNDEDVLRAIRNGYMVTHMNMWKELEKWPKTVTGLPSTAGTTASVAFIRRGKIYIGHVGDSAIVLGYQKDGSEEWEAKPLTWDHKPESTAEMERITRCGGKVVSKAGVPRVVWNRPRSGHKGPIKKNTPMDEIPFLAVARSLGDLWSYNTNTDEFIVSPDPDVGVLAIDPARFRCLIFGTDGLWNMISPEGAVNLVQGTEKHNEAALVSCNGGQPRDWLNPSKSLVDHALERWSNTRMRADNTSVVTLMLDPPGPPRAAVLRSRARPSPPAPLPAPHSPPSPPADPPSGLTIMTRYSEPAPSPASPAPAAPAPLPPCAEINARYSLGTTSPVAAPPTDSHSAHNPDIIANYGNPAESLFIARLLAKRTIVNTLKNVFEEMCGETASVCGCAPPPSTVLPEEPPCAAPAASDESGIQINEVSSSSPVEQPAKQRPRRAKPEPREPSHRVLRSHESEATPPPPRAVLRKHEPAPTPSRAVLRSHEPDPALTPSRAVLRSHEPTPSRAVLRSHEADTAPTPSRAVLRSHEPAPAPAPTPLRAVPRRAAPRPPPPLRATRARGPLTATPAPIPVALPPVPAPAPSGNSVGAGRARPRRGPALESCKENVRRAACSRARRRAEPPPARPPPPARALRPRNDSAPPAKRARAHKSPAPAPPAPLVLLARLRRRRAH